MGKLMSENRRDHGRFYFMGLTTNNLIAISVIFLGLVASGFSQYQVFGGVLNKVDVNTNVNREQNSRMEKFEQRMEEIRREYSLQLAAVKKSLKAEINSQQKVQREDMREIRKMFRELK